MFVRQHPGAPAIEVLPGVIGDVLRRLAFPKRMSWDAWLDDGKGAFPFGRPIRWLLALLDGQVVSFEIDSMVDAARGPVAVRSGGVTFGHRFLPRGSAGGPLSVASFAELERRLGESFVVLDPKARSERIRQGLAGAGGLGDDHALPGEWSNLVEYPTVVVGDIPSEFHSLPTEVLETVLVHHQKYLPLAKDGRRGARFAAIIDGDGANAAGIVRGMERVVVARLRDAAFFFAEDRKRTLASRVADLAGILFHRGLGTYKDKADRLVRLVDVMGEEQGLLTKPEHEASRQAALLCKADLTTLMVREFPELQGVMGAIYLRAEGDAWDGVAAAVRWHYHPLSIDEDAPPARALVGLDATVFAAVSLADKLDTLAGYFGIGLAPSGSSDPYGLRRAGQAAIRVLLDFWQADASERRPSLHRLLAAAVAGYGQTLREPPPEACQQLGAFLLDRLRYVLVARGHDADAVEAVLAARDPDALEDPHEAWVRLRALQNVRAEAREDFEHLAVAFKRAKNILAGAAGAVDPRLFEADAERDLHAAVARLNRGDGTYEARLRSLAELRAPVDRFFADVLVMAEDPALRANRLSLLAAALAPFYRIADISKLGG